MRKAAMTIHFDEMTLDRVRALRTKWGLSVAEFVRRAVIRSVDECERSGKPIDSDGSTWELGGN